MGRRVVEVVILAAAVSVPACGADSERPGATKAAAQLEVGAPSTPHAVLASPAAPELVSFATPDGGLVYADLYARADRDADANAADADADADGADDADHADRAVVLAHGAQFDKESWGQQARVLAAAGFRVLAIDFRGYGRSTGPGQEQPLGAPLKLDVLAAVRWLRAAGAKSVSVVGGSMGGTAAADASIEAAPGEIDRLVLLGAAASGPPEKLQGRKLFIVSRQDTRGDGVVRLDRIREQYERAPQPKELLVLEGAAHAQFLFATDQGERLMSEIVRFLSEP